MGRRFIITLSSFIVFCLSLILINAAQRGSKHSSNKDVGCCAVDMTGALVSGESIAYFEGEQIQIPQLAMNEDESRVLGVYSVYAYDGAEKWIEIDKSEQKLRAWEGDKMYLESLVSTGLPWYETPSGEFRIWIKLRYTKMEGGEGKYYYYLPNVPYTMFFYNDEVPSWKGYGLHGTYWHDDFGTPRSHGCVNLPTEVAGQLYYWTTPTLPDGKWAVTATNDNPGTRIVIHE